MDAPHKGRFRLFVRPGGDVSVMDLSQAFRPALAELGADRELWETRPCVALPLAETRRPGRKRLLAERAQIAGRHLDHCDLCARRCGANRRRGERGACGLDASLHVSAYTMLYGEGPGFGQPVFGVYTQGCALACEFCYRPEDRVPALDDDGMTPEALALLLDRAAEAGAQAWEFLGGNPDHSLPGLLEALPLARHSLPVIWNSALTLAPDAIDLLRGIVDVWAPDFKFWTAECAGDVARCPEYAETVRENLLALSGEEHVVVRHMAYPGHEECCRRPILEWVRRHLPKATVQELSYMRVEP